MLCDPKKLTQAALDVAAEIIYVAADRCVSKSQLFVLFNDLLADLLDEAARRRQEKGS